LLDFHHDFTIEQVKAGAYCLIVGHISLQEVGMPLKGRIKVNEMYCKGCELCVNACPQHVLALASDHITAKGYHPAVMITADCTGCGICSVVCPEAAITVFREKAGPTDRAA
jgi:2-oxoglutarate ferredoxin oxidoreductase subunit delta